ncbi:hypothetical protein KA089_01125 [Candidatus Woesebacteria bacterium]|nr:hypothetical protein [Candidatus Woesebacteria bacterium]
MLNTEKLLYILPDLTYIAELLPGKKEHTYSIQSFKQINGKFLDENELISANIQKLFTKIDKEEYHLILPDFLFTNTIVNVRDDSESGAIAHVKNELLPNLDISNETHEIEITVLTSFKGNSKVQISAIEKAVLAPIRVASEKSKTVIKAVSPLSWAIKSIVSLEPSITVLQIGENLFSSQHYIGIDQTNNFPVEELSSIVETIKTLKGAEPSIQTIYLASSSLIEEKLKEELGGTLPIQQLATFKDEDSKMPSYVKYIIESCMKTLSISDFPVPKFKLGKATKDEENLFSSENEVKIEDKKLDTSINTAQTKLPEPSKVPNAVISAKAEDVITMPKEIKEKEEVETEKVEADTKIVNKDEKETDKIKPEPIEDKPVTKDEIDLGQFAGKEVSENDDDTSKTEEAKVENEKAPTSQETRITKKVIKNSSGVNNMLKMVFITLAVFFITIAIGIGVGLGLLKISDKSASEEVATVVVSEPESTPEPTTTPEPVVEINKDEVSILVVNATTKAGYAGKIKTVLVEEIKNVIAGNAEGTYEEGTDYVLMLEENEQLKMLLEEVTDLKFEFASGIETEDPDGDYDAVIVLAK